MWTKISSLYKTPFLCLKQFKNLTLRAVNLEKLRREITKEVFLMAMSSSSSLNSKVWCNATFILNLLIRLCKHRRFSLITNKQFQLIGQCLTRCKPCHINSLLIKEECQTTICKSKRSPKKPQSKQKTLELIQILSLRNCKQWTSTSRVSFLKWGTST